MTQRQTIRLILTLLFFASAAANSLSAFQPRQTMPPTPSSLHMPFMFVQNHGETAKAVRYTGTGQELRAWFEDGGVILRRRNATVHVSFERPHASAESIRITPGTPTGAAANYLIGKDSRQWRSGLPLLDGIRYTGVWPGVELTYRSEGGGLEAEYVVAPEQVSAASGSATTGSRRFRPRVSCALLLRLAISSKRDPRFTNW